MLRKIALAGVGILMVVSPMVASAQSTDITVKIAALLEQIKQLQALMAQLEGQVGRTAPCVNISDNLTLGSSSDQVSALQNYLITKGLLDAQYKTGYYGFITAKAVGSLQVDLEILSSVNDPAYGIVGPKTRAALSCGDSTTSPPTSSQNLSPDMLAALKQLPTPPLPPSDTEHPSATLDVSTMSFSAGSKDAGLATITGAAKGVNQVIIALKGGGSATTNVVNGRFEAIIGQIYPGTYAVQVSDNDAGPNYGIQLATGNLTMSSTNAPSTIPSATIDQNSLSASTLGKDAAAAIISGTATNVTSISISLDQADGGAKRINTSVVAGRWSVTFPSVTPGIHSVTVIDADQNSNYAHTLATGILTITFPSYITSATNAHPNTPFVLTGITGAASVEVVLVSQDYRGSTDWANVGQILKSSTYVAAGIQTTVTGVVWSAAFGGLPEGTYNIYVYDVSTGALLTQGTFLSTLKG